MLPSAPPAPHPLAPHLLAGRLHDPFALLGVHHEAGAWKLRVFAPYASNVRVKVGTKWRLFKRIDAQGLFELRSKTPIDPPCLLRIESEGAEPRETYDPYGFPATISGADLHLFNGGRLEQGYRVLGARCMDVSGIPGVRFAVWAPNAERVSVVGDFNRWDGRVHPMRVHGASGVWELFIPGLAEGTLYKFEIRNRASGVLLVKTDPYGDRFEFRPGTAAKVTGPARHAWGDAHWMDARASRDWLRAPMSIYELHAGSWRRHPDGRYYGYLELADALIPYIADLGFTHIEMLPLSEHPLDESWGYQTTGYFAPTLRHGEPDHLRAFVDRCHQAGIGVILDWVPGHFPKDAWALARFDGTALYEHEDPRLGEHAEWGTHVFNYGRSEVKSFLLSSAHCWLASFHFDGLRVDAVASMLYLDYSRKEGEWLPNRHGGRENLEAIEFLRELNVMVHGQFPGALTIAEESTAWPMVSRPAYLGGLGFSMKWNMGWMHDSLAYLSQDPVYRRYHHDRLTFGQIYAWTENFVLPLSHDEVVHGKRSLIGKMAGDDWQKRANLRLLYAYQFTYPGKKLLFMGAELAQWREWNSQAELDWALLGDPKHGGIHALVRDLNRLYRNRPQLHSVEFEQAGFRWIDCHDVEQSVVSYLRFARDGSFVVVVLNFTPVPRFGYRLGVPAAGRYAELLNSDSRHYGGTDLGNPGELQTEALSWMGEACSLRLTLPPLAAIVIAPA